jgi:CheY-like chemotaxis protein
MTGKEAFDVLYLPGMELFASLFKKASMEQIPSSAGKIILVVEDDENTRYVLWLILSDAERYYPMLVNDPYQAILVATQRRPDLFLIDYNLPHMNGIELYDRLHVLEGLEEVPAILLSALRGEWQQELQDRHISGLEKPFALNTLLELIERTLVNQEKSTTADSGAQAPPISA